MAFFDEIGKKITETSQGVVQKTKDTAEIMKVNGYISDEQKKITNLYTRIGQMYFEKYADSCEKTFEDSILQIKEANTKIKDYQEQLRKLKGVVACPNCGNDVAYGSPFCSTCGSKMNMQAPDSVAAQNNNVRRCLKCGLPLGPNTIFCTNCGTKAAPAPAPAPAATPAAPTPVATPAAPAPAAPVYTPPVAPAPTPAAPVFTPDPAPAPTPVFTPDPAPAPTPVFTPDPAPAPTPVFTPDPAPISDNNSFFAPAAEPTPEPQSVGTILCRGCGKEIPADSKFCIGCGTKL